MSSVASIAANMGCFWSCDFFRKYSGLLDSGGLDIWELCSQGGDICCWHGAMEKSIEVRILHAYNRGFWPSDHKIPKTPVFRFQGFTEQLRFFLFENNYEVILDIVGFRVDRYTNSKLFRVWRDAELIVCMHVYTYAHNNRIPSSNIYLVCGCRITPLSSHGYISSKSPMPPIWGCATAGYASVV